MVHIYPSKDGLVRMVKLLMADGHLGDHGKCQGPPSYLNRPIHKLVVLLTADEVVEMISTMRPGMSPSRSQERMLEDC